MGAVWLARVERESDGLNRGDAVAVKVIHHHLLANPLHRQRFLREADLGKSVRHKNVVHTHAAKTFTDEQGEVICLVMEYVAGRTLRELVKALGTVPETLLREIGRQASEGLVAIHERGIVHRDLKPENILITEDQQVRIMDLGVARLVEQSVALTREGQFAGSLQYAAPEQFRGREATAASDLYSLGVVLYELAVGHNPFGHGDAARVIASHLQEVPHPPAEITVDVSPFLSRVLSVLLEKDPARRFGTAAELAGILGEGEASEWWSKNAIGVDPSESPRPVVPVRRETGLYGRDTELETFREVIEEVKSGSGRFVLLEGEAGIGKSRFVDSFLNEIRKEPVRVLYGSYPPSGGLGALTQAIVGCFGERRLTEDLRRHLDVAPGLALSFSRLIRNESPAPEDEPIPPSALHTLFCRLLTGLAGESPVVWVIEDLHFADPDSRAIVLSLARSAATLPALILATTRPGLPEADVASFSALPQTRRVPLGRLSPREVIDLLREAFRSASLAERLGGKIAWKSDGVPFFVFEMIRTLDEGNFIERQEDGTYVEARVIEELDVPSAIRDLIEARLGELARSEREIVDVGAVDGYEFDPILIAEVLERPRIRVLQDLASLERLTGLVRSEGRRCRFDHHQIQEVLYRDLSDALRAEYHASLAHAVVLREGGPDRLSADAAAFVVHHHLRGSRPEEAAPLISGVLEFLEKASRNDAAIDIAERAVAIPGFVEGKTRVEVLLTRTRLLDRIGRQSDVAVDLVEAQKIVAGLGEPQLAAKVERAIGIHRLREAKFDEAGEHFHRAREMAVELEDTELEALLAGNLGALAGTQHLWDESLEAFESCVELARRAGNHMVAANAIGNMGLVQLLRGRSDEAARLYDECLELTRDSGDRGGEAMILLRIGGLDHDLGRFEEARERFESALTGFRSIGDRLNEAASMGSLGNVYGALGRPLRAIECYERCLALCREIGDRIGEGNALMNLGYPYLLLGDPDRAEEIFAVCREVSEETGDRIQDVHACEGLGAVADHREDREEAERFYREALETAREIGYGLGLADITHSLGVTLMELGRPEEARPLLEESLRLGEETSQPGQVVLALAALAEIGAVETEKAVRAFEENRDRLRAATRMDLAFQIFGLTQDHAYLADAKELLDELRERAPEAYRDTVVTNVPLHQRIRSADAE
jgi:serine/threonine protein kinase/tetratricopeptide (TPR) repeat protein